MNSGTSQTTRKSLVVLIVVIGLLWATIAAAFFARNDIYDWWRLRNYSPSEKVVQLADDTTMNDETRRLFYVYRPEIAASDTFNTRCRDSEYTIVLGCYIQYDGIYIFNIDDPRLEGVQQVTAAHELLHAAYDRLSTKERQRIDALTADMVKNITDQRVIDTIALYRDNDPSSVPNELHSIIGTEVRDISDELEKHYAQYFTDRSKIVQYSEQYATAFSGRKKQIDTLEQNLVAMKQKIDVANQEIESQNTYVQSENNRLQNRISAGTATNQEIDAFNTTVREYNNKVRRAARLIDNYNSTYEQYKSIVGEHNELFDTIDSRPKAVETQ